MRLVDRVSVVVGEAPPRWRCAFGLAPSKVRDRGWVGRRADRAGWVRGVGGWAPGQSVPWWLTTKLDGTVAAPVGLDHRRMAIEQLVRETTGSRVRLGLGRTPVRPPHALARLILLAGVALVVWLAVGAMVARARPAARRPHRALRPRVSLVALGRSWLAHVRERLTLEWICAQLPPPTAALRLAAVHQSGGVKVINPQGRR